jgi:hypothetical protein
MKHASRLLTILAVGTLLGACRAKGHSPFVNPPAGSAPTVKYPGLNVQPPLIKPEQFSIPVGPRLMILPGRGLGPIRFGASIPTIERLMDAKCTTKTEELCRYAPQAVEFLLTDGKLTEIRVQGDERPFPGGGGTPDNTYGIFNGYLPPKAEFGMYEKVVIESVGQPLSAEKLDPPQGKTVLRHTYPNNTVLEYDVLANGNTVLAGVILKPDPEAIAASRAAALAPLASAAPAAPEPTTHVQGKPARKTKKPHRTQLH